MQATGRLLVFLLVAAIGPALAAQSLPGASIVGRVTDAATAAPLADARLRVEGSTRETTSGRDGTYVLTAVPVGERLLLVSYLGYPEARVKVTVGADRRVEQNIALGSEVVEMQKFVVGGEYGAQARALNAQRAAINVTNVVSADTMGKLSDSNIAEALKRLPSISLVDNQQTGEGEYIAIRGMDAGLNSYSVNGVRVGTAASGNRSVSLNQISADGLESVSVAKSLTPDYDADAIGGAVDLRTPTGFDLGARVLRAGAEVSYNDFTKETSYKGRAGFGDILLGGKLGVYVGLNFERKKILAEETENSGDWEPYNYFQSPNTFAADNDTVQQQGIDLARWNNELKRRGLNGSFDYKPSAHTRLHLRYQYSDYKQDTMRSEVDVRNTREPNGFGTLVQVNVNDTTLPQPVIVGRDPVKGAIYQLTPAQVVDQDADGVITDRDRRNAANTAAARVAGGRGDTDGLYSLGGRSGVWAPRGFFVGRSFALTKDEAALGNVDVGGDSRLGALRLDYNVAYSYAKKNRPLSVSLGFQSRDEAPFNQQGVFFTYPDQRYPKWQLPAAAAAAVNDDGKLYLNSAGASQTFVKNEQWLAQANARYDFDAGQSRAFVKGGFKVRQAERKVDSNTLLNLARNGNATLASVGDLIEGRDTEYLDGNYNFGPYMSAAAIERAVMEVDKRLFTASNPVTALSLVQSDKKGRETVSAGYLMGGVTLGKLGLTGGARIEDTQVKNTVWRSDRNAAPAPSKDSRWDAATGTSGFADTKGSYTNVTPSVHANYRASDRLVVRSAVWTSIARPNYEWIEAGETYTRDAAGQITAITRGNPDLKPAYATNFDLGAELYTRNTGLLSANLFHKRIDKFIFSSKSEREGSTETVNGQPVPVTQPQNGARATITGVELSFMQQLRSLPAPWSGFGYAINYTYQVSEAESNIAWRTGRKIDFINAPRRLWNAALFYEYRGFEARLAATFNDKYLEDLRNFGHDKWVQARTYVDVKVSYRLLPHVQIGLEGHNLTGDAVYWATHGPSQGFQKDFTRTGRTYLLGVTWSH